MKLLNLFVLLVLLTSCASMTPTDRKIKCIDRFLEKNVDPIKALKICNSVYKRR